jgi:DNA polymerase III subunit epsilon
MLAGLARMLRSPRLRDPRWAFLREPDATGEVVSLDCETTGLDPRIDQVLTIAAIRIKGRRILCADRLVLTVRPEGLIKTDAVRVHWLRPVDVASGEPMAEALPKLLEFIGSRPLIGYFIKFDVEILSRYCRNMIGIDLPSRMIDVSSLYYDYRYKGRHWIDQSYDLKFDTIRRELDLPVLPQHDAYLDALSAAMIYVSLIDKISRR